MTDEQTVARVRLLIFEQFLKDAQAPVVEELMIEFSLPRETVTAILDATTGVSDSLPGVQPQG